MANNAPLTINRDVNVGTVAQQPTAEANFRTAITHASVASNGANAIVGSIGAAALRVPGPMQLVSAWWEPTGADSAGSSTASYRKVLLINAGPAGLDTTVLASLGLTATVGSNTVRSMVLASNPVVRTGDIIAFQQATVGGANSDHTVLVAGTAQGNWRPV